MIIPLGLLSKLIKAPIGIMVIVVLCLITTIRNQEDVEKYNKEITQIIGEDETKNFNKASKECPLKFPKRNKLCPASLKDKPESYLLNLRLKDHAIRKIEDKEIREYFNQFKQTKEAKEKLILAAHRNPIGYLPELPLTSLFVANFNHGGVMHILFNVIFIIAFGVHVEQRLGSFNTLFLSSLFGMLGILTEIVVFDHYVLCLGASATASALMGMTLAYFWREKMAFYLFFVIANKKIYLPLLLAVPAFFVANDLAGLLDTSTNVAHLGHLSGFLFGFLGALIDQKLRPIGPHLFPQEKEFYHKAKQAKNYKQRFLMLKKCLELSPNNEKIFNQLVKLEKKYGKKTQETRDLLSRFASLFMDAKVKSTTEELYKFILFIRPVVNLKAVLKEVNWSHSLRLGDFAVEREQYAFAIALYKITILNAPRKRIYMITKTIKNIEDYIKEQERETLEPIRSAA